MRVLVMTVDAEVRSLFASDGFYLVITLVPRPPPVLLCTASIFSAACRTHRHKQPFICL